MSYMRSTDSAVLAEFGRILEEKEGLKKIAQSAPGASEQVWANAMKHGPNTTAWKQAKEMFAGDAAKKALLDKAEYVYFNDSENDANAWKKVFEQAPAAQPPAMATQPAPGTPVAAAPPATASAKTTTKTAEEKKYDVSGKEDLVNEAHPGKAMVEGEVVENLNQQQDADKAVAEKSAKTILVALYKLAKRLKAENNEKAYALVKETFLDLSKSFKK